jgi:hypothetical protein
MRCWGVFLFASAGAWAQVSGPVLGLVPDGPRIREMVGLPGAGKVGNPWKTGRELAAIAVSSNPGFALGTATGNGQVVMIATGGAATPLAGVNANPDRIVMSPGGASAGFWFTSSSLFQIVSGLPGSPAVRNINAAFPGGTPVAFAVSDDGNWLAGAWTTGVYAFGPDGSVTQLPADGRVAALAFFSQSTNLALASPQHISEIADIGGKATYSLLYDSQNDPLAPAGIGTTADNARVVMADTTGAIYSINLATNNVAVVECECAPAGLFGLGGTAFRLTSLSSGVKVFDASTGSILVVPWRRPMKRVDKAAEVLPMATTPLPALTISGLPATDGFEQQPNMTISMASAYPTTVTGTALLTFVPSVGGGDQMIQFSNGSYTANFTIPAGSTQANFSGASSINVLTGTVAGTITVAITAVSAGGTNFPGPFPSVTTVTSPTVPFIKTVTLSTTSTTATVVVTGFASSRDMVNGLFTFAPSMNSSISQAAITVPLSAAFTAWYSSSASVAYGSEFTLTIPFTVQGSALDLVAVTVTLTDSKGTSNPVSQ